MQKFKAFNFRALAKRKGWAVADVYRDAGRSAWQDGRERPAFDRMLADLEAGKIDAALLWGPIGGPLVKAGHPDLTATPLLKETAPPRLVFRITMGVRAGEDEWKRQLNSLIRRNQAEIDAILRDAGVPILDDFGKGAKPASG